MIDRFKGSNIEAQNYARKKRIHSQIRKAMLEGRTKYYYNVKDKKIIEEWIKENGKLMEFIEEA